MSFRHPSSWWPGATLLWCLSSLAHASVVWGKPAALSLHSTISLLGPQAELDPSLFLLETGTLWSFVLSSCYLSSLWSRRAKKLTKQNARFPFLQTPRDVLKESLGVLRGLDRETFSLLSHSLSAFPCLLFHLFMMNSAGQVCGFPAECWNLLWIQPWELWDFLFQQRLLCVWCHFRDLRGLEISVSSSHQLGTGDYFPFRKLTSTESW